MAASANPRRVEHGKSVWEKRQAKQAEIERKAALYDEQQTERGMADAVEKAMTQDAIDAARTIMREAMDLISYSYRSDIERQWRERWPWLEKSGE